jgi:hypothetical protein
MLYYKYMAESVSDIPSLLGTDSRCQALYTGLDQLNDEDLGRLKIHLDDEAPVVVDTHNYDAETQTWCPLAVALESHQQSPDPALDDAAAKKLIVDEGIRRYGTFSLNPISGVEGKFFTDNRYHDLRALVGYMSIARQTQASE